MMIGIVYRDNLQYYTKCTGREEIYHVDFDQLEYGVMTYWKKGPIMNLPVYHPYYLMSALLFSGYFVAVPVIYLCIYQYRKKHDTDVTGR